MQPTIIRQTSGQSNLTQGRITTADRWLNRMRHLAKKSIQLNFCFLWPTRVHNPNSKSICSAIFAQVSADRSHGTHVILYNWHPFLPKLPLPMGNLKPHLTHDSLGPSKPTNQTASRSIQLFLHEWSQSVPILYNGMPLSPSKLSLPMVP